MSVAGATRDHKLSQPSDRGGKESRGRDVMEGMCTLTTAGEVTNELWRDVRWRWRFPTPAKRMRRQSMSTSESQTREQKKKEEKGWRFNFEGTSLKEHKMH